MIFRVVVFHKDMHGTMESAHKVDAPSKKELIAAMERDLRHGLSKSHPLQNCFWCPPEYQHDFFVRSMNKAEIVLVDGKFVPAAE